MEVTNTTISFIPYFCYSKFESKTFIHEKRHQKYPFLKPTTCDSAVYPCFPGTQARSVAIFSDMPPKLGAAATPKLGAAATSYHIVRHCHCWQKIGKLRGWRCAHMAIKPLAFGRRRSEEAKHRFYYWPENVMMSTGCFFSAFIVDTKMSNSLHMGFPPTVSL
eukprot:3421603-Rhodomonas_salina.1